MTDEKKKPDDEVSEEQLEDVAGGVGDGTIPRTNGDEAGGGTGTTTTTTRPKTEPMPDIPPPPSSPPIPSK